MDSHKVLKSNKKFIMNLQIKNFRSRNAANNKQATPLNQDLNREAMANRERVLKIIDLSFIL